jgi:hypothetical protein
MELQAKLEIAKAKAVIAQKVATGELEWNQTMAEASANSWKDEWLTILVSIPLILAFTGHHDIVMRMALLRWTLCQIIIKLRWAWCLLLVSGFNQSKI